jgi:hypothetical protein
MNFLPAPERRSPQAGPASPRRAAAPSTRGFGPLIEQEYALETSVRDNLLFVDGPRSAEIRLILERQQGRIAGGIMLIEQRVESLPYPGRFRALVQLRAHAFEGMPVARETGLAHLAHQHLDLQDSLLALAEQQSATGRPERILRAVARNHEEMAWMLNALLSEDDTVRDRELLPIVATASPDAVEQSWENEGGAARLAPLTP